jgi:hypothetical protein
MSISILAQRASQHNQASFAGRRGTLPACVRVLRAAERGDNAPPHPHPTPPVPGANLNTPPPRRATTVPLFPAQRASVFSGASAQRVPSALRTSQVHKLTSEEVNT